MHYLISNIDADVEPLFPMVGWHGPESVLAHLSGMTCTSSGTLHAREHFLDRACFAPLRGEFATVDIDWKGCVLMRYQSRNPAHAPFMVILKDVSLIGAIHRGLTRISVHLAKAGNRLPINAALWARAELMASRQMLRPKSPIAIDRKFTWRLERPVNPMAEKLHLEWTLFTAAAGAFQPVINLQTDFDGAIAEGPNLDYLRSLAPSLMGDGAPTVVLGPEIGRAKVEFNKGRRFSVNDRVRAAQHN
ncbi:MAG: hypothetical protein E6Q76_05745 [Rhizobium sp.]|nr:MAG: hypothetical protein E6Q76_05745 [Rhizobium sp.]